MSTVTKYKCDACGAENLITINVIEGPIEFCYRTGGKPVWNLVTAGTKWEHICSTCRDKIENKIREIADVLRQTKLTVREIKAPSKAKFPDEPETRTEN